MTHYLTSSEIGVQSASQDGNCDKACPIGTEIAGTDITRP